MARIGVFCVRQPRDHRSSVSPAPRLPPFRYAIQVYETCMQGKAWRLVCSVVSSSHPSSFSGVHPLVPYPPSQAKPMSTGVPSLADNLVDFTVQLDGLCADQNQDKLSDALRGAFNQHVLYNLYVLDTERVKALLEVFDKVLSRNIPPENRFSASMHYIGPSGQ